MAASRLGFMQKLSIRRCVSSRRLACGCSLGIYETYNGEVLAVLDAREAACGRADHEEGVLVQDPIDETPGVSPPARIKGGNR